MSTTSIDQTVAAAKQSGKNAKVVASNGHIKNIKSLGFSTKAVHAGVTLDPYTRAIVTPIHQSTIFAFEGFCEPGPYEYSRCGNPTRKALEDNLAALEGGVYCAALATGQAAELTLLNRFGKGDHIICGNDVYGGTIRLFNHLKKQAGLEVSFIPMINTDRVAAEIRPNTKALWIETPSNPLFNIVDLVAIVDLAKANNLNTIVDNTLLTPCCQQPLNFGADFVIHSATKYLSGHNDGLGGAIICKHAHHVEEVGFIANALGAVLGAFDSWLILRGIKTLPLRMREHQKSALQIARFLEDHPSVEKVYYPGLDSHPQFDLIQKQTSGYGGMISFKVHGGVEKARTVVEGTDIFFLTESFGGVESLIQHPQTMSHSSMTADAQLDAGITENLIRISVGLEDVEDLIADLDEALGS
jgi:cystathionine beta-lyase/cystathionine gamma-synthase